MEELQGPDLFSDVKTKFREFWGINEGMPPWDKEQGEALGWFVNVLPILIEPDMFTTVLGRDNDNRLWIPGGKVDIQPTLQKNLPGFDFASFQKTGKLEQSKATALRELREELDISFNGGNGDPRWLLKIEWRLPPDKNLRYYGRWNGDFYLVRLPENFESEYQRLGNSSLYPIRFHRESIVNIIRSGGNIKEIIVRMIKFLNFTFKEYEVLGFRYPDMFIQFLLIALSIFGEGQNINTFPIYLGTTKDPETNQFYSRARINWRGIPYYVYFSLNARSPFSVVLDMDKVRVPRASLEGQELHKNMQLQKQLFSNASDPPPYHVRREGRLSNSECSPINLNGVTQERKFHLVPPYLLLEQGRNRVIKFPVAGGIEQQLSWLFEDDMDNSGSKTAWFKQHIRREILSVLGSLPVPILALSDGITFRPYFIKPDLVWRDSRGRPCIVDYKYHTGIDWEHLRLSSWTRHLSPGFRTTAGIVKWITGMPTIPFYRTSGYRMSAYLLYFLQKQLELDKLIRGEPYLVRDLNTVISRWDVFRGSLQGTIPKGRFEHYFREARDEGLVRVIQSIDMGELLYKYIKFSENIELFFWILTFSNRALYPQPPFFIDDKFITYYASVPGIQIYPINKEEDAFWLLAHLLEAKKIKDKISKRLAEQYPTCLYVSLGLGYKSYIVCWREDERVSRAYKRLDLDSRHFRALGFYLPPGNGTIIQRVAQLLTNTNYRVLSSPVVGTFVKL